MRAPFQEASMPRIRALGGAGRASAGSAKAGSSKSLTSKAALTVSFRPPASRAASRGAAASGPVRTTAAGHVFRDFVATLERLERGRRRKAMLARNADASAVASPRSGKEGPA
ncbi:MAG: hypothetical protein AB7E29_02050 [Xanthobacter sp.]